MNYEKLKKTIITGDSFVVGESRKPTLFSWLTRLVDLSSFTHAGSFVWQGDELMIAEMLIKSDQNPVGGFVVQPAKKRLDSMLEHYNGVYLLKAPNCVHEKQGEVLKVLASFKGRKYSKLKIITVSLDLSYLSKRAVCSTLPATIYRKCGHRIKGAAHPQEILENSVCVGQYTG